MRRWRVLLYGTLLALLAALSWPAYSQAGEIAVARLPPEARAVLEQIRAGGPFAHQRDGIVFGNREGLLPEKARGYYREYTVPTPGRRDRGARRIVAGRGGERYYTGDHYRSFRRVRQ